ncbi:MAG: acetate--CoA ligase family protein [Alphaproteobacteria bacterium]|nr:acetate--CoA ligase family protein [Alphaproteobacteria bacterium]
MTPGQRDNLRRLLAPRHVALIGGDDADVAAIQCAAAGFKGPIWGVNPRRKELGGRPCFARVEDLPEAPDAVFLAVPRAAVGDIVGALSRVGAGGVICYTAGDLALVGPNCYGLINYVHDAVLWPYGHGGTRVNRGVALVSQSGMLGTNLTMNRRSVPFAYVISAGNMAMLGVEDYLEVLIEDPAVAAIGLYLETLRDIPRFADIAGRTLEAGIPIVALKAGSSEIGARLTVTHTGSLAGADDLYQALFDRLGVIRVDTPVTLLETLKMLIVAGAPAGRRVAGFTCSGGDAAMLADGAGKAGISFDQPSPGAAKDLADRLPNIATVSNPLDYTTPLWGDPDRMPAIFQALIGDGYDAALLVQDYPAPEIDTDRDSYLTDARSFAAATRAAGIPGAICSDLPENIDRKTRDIMVELGVAPLQGISEAMTAMAGAAFLGERRAVMAAAGGAAAFRLRTPPLPHGDLEILDEWAGKQRLAAAGIAVPAGRLVGAEAAPAAAEEIGFPVVAKLADPRMPHKSEAGAVRVGLNSPAAVAEAVAAIANSVADYQPGFNCDVFLIERMIVDAIAELLIGIRRDDVFGHVMVLASGGVLVELVGDARALLLPIDRDGIARALASLKVSELLAGYRGGAAADIDAVVDAVLKVAEFADTYRDKLEELDINPLMVRCDGVVAADVLLRIAR